MQAGIGNTNSFWLRRIHSLLGFIPFGIYLPIHFAFNSTIFSGPQAFTDFVKSTQGFALTIFLEIGLLAVPILFHIILGIVIVYSGSSNVTSYGYYRNWMYTLQRISGMILVPFLFIHIWKTRLHATFSGHHVDAVYMSEYLSPFGTKMLYVIGIVAAAFHLSNGVSTMLMTWGITQSERSQDIVSKLMWLVFLLMSVWGIAIVFAF